MGNLRQGLGGQYPIALCRQQLTEELADLWYPVKNEDQGTLRRGRFGASEQEQTALLGSLAADCKKGIRYLSLTHLASKRE